MTEQYKHTEIEFKKPEEIKETSTGVLQLRMDRLQQSVQAQGSEILKLHREIGRLKAAIDHLTTTISKK